MYTFIYSPYLPGSEGHLSAFMIIQDIHVQRKATSCIVTESTEINLQVEVVKSLFHSIYEQN